MAFSSAVHPEGPQVRPDRGCCASLLIFVAGRMGRRWAGRCSWADDLGRGVLSRSGARDAEPAPELIVAPADGLVTMIERRAARRPNWRRGGAGVRHRFDARVDLHVGVRRSHQPYADRWDGAAASSISRASSSMPISTRRAEENERQHLAGRRARTAVAVGFTQIAGLVARRIVPFRQGRATSLPPGSGSALIRFGSRVDVYLPEGTACRSVDAGAADVGRRDDPRPASATGAVIAAIAQ